MPVRSTAVTTGVVRCTVVAVAVATWTSVMAVSATPARASITMFAVSGITEQFINLTI